MSIHPSLSSSDKHKRHKSVLKRFERIKGLFDKDKWKEGDTMFGLPKTKIVKIKIKKEKAAPAAEGVTAEGAPALEEKTKGKESTAQAAPKEKVQQEKKK